MIYYGNEYYYLKDEEEVNEFVKNPRLYYNYLETIKKDVRFVSLNSFEVIASILLEAKPIEYQSCCPLTIVHEKQMKNGKIFNLIFFIGQLNFSTQYKGLNFVFESSEKLIKFLKTPEKYSRLNVPVKKISEEKSKVSDQINFENTVNYLENHLGSIITKGLLELSQNKIKYPYLTVKETSLKYLALFLKANNPNNNEFGKIKYAKKLNEFLKNSKLPYELLEVYEKYQKTTNNQLQKDLIRKQLNNLGEKNDELMEKAKIQKNTRFNNFFKN